MKRRLLMALTCSLVLAATLAPAACNPCRDDGDVAICGDFGELGWVEALWGDQRLQWPAVATERATVLVVEGDRLSEIGHQGGRIELETLAGTASAPSLADDGRIFVSASDSNGQVSVNGASDVGLVTWSQPIGGDSVTTPPAIGGDELHVAVTADGRTGRQLTTLRASDGTVVRTRDDASPAAVAADGCLQYLVGAEDCGATFQTLVTEERDRTERWRYSDASGIRDFAPGPDGEVYVVTGDRSLVRVSAQGEVEWTFQPDCKSCNVAAAPTVTAEAVYFPVWQGWAQNGGCDDPEPQFPSEETLDPLYALRRDGTLLWKYDGFDTLGAPYDSNSAMLGPLALSMQTAVRHHPSGRPTVAEDGTLYVATDGAVVALDRDGQQLGWAMYNSTAGEVRSGDGGLMTFSSVINTGLAPAPVLGPDGSLYVWDGASIRAFRTGKPAAKIPWGAPFGGYRNAGRVGG
ncbi:MAG: PQQ-like beta-propeller repeat protein [Deltaproteobacteria bacterium]|nr:PQQ-like beta-propeller repeat protein [Deltaproteobacteria bacterium]